jgi:hypothetical protein
MAAKRIAIVGGQPGRIALCVPGLQFTYFGSIHDGGMGELKQLKAALKGGAVDQVVFMVRFCGHSMLKAGALEAKRAGVPFFVWPNGVSGLEAELRRRA